MSHISIWMLISFGMTFYSNDLTDVHDIHLSKSEIAYNQKEEAIQISAHIFIDDLELSLANKGIEGLKIATKDEDPNADEFIHAYLEETLQVSISEDVLKSNFIGKELSEDLMAIWCYLEIPNISSCENLTVINSILVELYEDQRNIVQVQTPNLSKQYFIFDAKDLKKVFDCE